MKERVALCSMVIILRVGGGVGVVSSVVVNVATDGVAGDGGTLAKSKRGLGLGMSREGVGLVAVVDKVLLTVEAGVGSCAAMVLVEAGGMGRSVGRDGRAWAESCG